MKYMIFLLLIVVVIALMAATMLYLSNRFSLFYPSIPKKTWLFGFMGLLIFFLIGVVAFSLTSNPFGKGIYIVAGLVCVALLFLFFSLVLIDLVSLLFTLSPSVRGILTLSLCFVLSLGSVWNAYTIRVKEVVIPIQGLTKEVRALHLTDVHLGNFRGKRQVQRIVRKINELNPDVIFNTGDMFDSKVHFTSKEEVLSPFRTLKIPHFFVYGNHDEYVGSKNVIQLMQAAGAKVLSNEVDRFGELQIIGLNNMLVKRNSFDPHARPNSASIEEVMQALQVNPDEPTLVLHHRPDGVEYMQDKGVDLLLAGHTHAGQLFPFTFLAKAMFAYNKGLYTYKDMYIYVSEGLGTAFFPIRLATKSEITLVRLVPKKP